MCSNINNLKTLNIYFLILWETVSGYLTWRGSKEYITTNDVIQLTAEARELAGSRMFGGNISPDERKHVRQSVSFDICLKVYAACCECV